MTMFRYKPKKRSTFYPVIVCSLLICTSLSAQSTEPQNEQDAARAQAAAELWRDAIEPGVFPPEPESRLIKKAEQKEEGKGNVASVDAYSASSGSFTGLNIGNMVLDRLKVSEQVTPETTDLFGETIDLNTGAVSFQQTDVSLPGNSSLPVEVRRIFRGASYAHHTSLNFGDWQLAIPSYGTARLYNNRLFSGSWGTGNLCTGRLNPGLFGPGPSTVIAPGDYWSGDTLDIPGVVNEKVQIIANKKTIKNWKFSCIQAGAIEGITATSPQGVTYTFTEPKLIPTTSLTALNAFGNWELVPKYHAFLLLTQMADRFGNTVTYSYSQGQLTQISSNDGRVISLTYENNPYGKARVKTVTANGRSWNYSYTNATNPHNIDYLTTVQRPDQKSWSYNLSTVNRGSAGIATDRVFYYNIGGGGESSYTITNASETQCIQPSYAPIQSASITHPNGAQLALEFKTTLFGRSEVPKIQSHLSYPVHTHDLCFLANSVTKKTLSQAGLPSMVWAYSYSQNTGKWAGVAGDQTLTGLYSTPTGYNLVDLRATRVTAPDGSKTAHIFSRKWDVTDGQEVATEYYDTNGTTILKRIERSFAGQSTGGNAELFSFTGFENGAQYDFENEAPHENYVNKTKETVFQYNGSAADSFITQYSNFNSYGVPQTIAESTSTHATTRTTTVGYQHDTTNWVLNLETNRQRVQGGQSVSLSSATYYGATETGKSMPKTQSSFGQLQQTHTYDTTGLLTRTDYPISNRWVQYSSYKRGQPQTITLPGRMNAATTISASQAVDNNGWVTSTTDLNGNVTSYGYDGLGRLTLIDPTDSRWSNTTITYDTDYSGIGALQQNITRGNFRKTVYLDGLMRPVLTQEWDSADSVATTRYTKRQFNAYGKELFVSRPSVSSSETYGSTTVFDGLQRPKSVTNTATGDISYSYQTGNQTIITNGRGYTTSTAYQAFGSPDSSLAKTISQPESATTTIAYNAADLPTSITQGDDGKPSLQRFAAIVPAKRPDTGVTVYTYNVLGQVTGMAEGLTGTGSTCTNYTNTASAWSTHSYDNLGALSSISYADGSPAKSYTLDPQGNVTRLSSGSGSGAAVWDYTYNSAHLVETEILTVDNQSWPLDPSYNGLGHLTSLVYPSGTSVSYAPNALGQAKQAGTYATNAAYHPNGQLKSFSYGNGLTFTQSLDGEYRPYEREVKSGSTLRVGQRYNYDANDNLNAITDLMNSSKNLSLGFDGLDRLTTANGYWGNGSLSYNQVGNITGKTLGTQALTYAYDTNNRLTSVTGGYSFSYDGRGTVTNNGKRTFTVNSANQMTGSGAISYVYDGHNRRVKKVNGSSIQYSLYDQGGTFLSTTGTNGPTEHIYLGSQLVARISQVVTADDKPGYTGHLEDKDIGLTYMQQRYYDPVIGRFYSNDPVGFTPSNPMMFNRYAYGNNNPYKFVDPDGKAVSIVIERNSVSENTVMSTISVSSDKTDKSFQGFTLEDRKGGINRDKDPIKADIYSGSVRQDGKRGWRIELEAKNNYTNVQIHVGNTAKDVEGCFAAGTTQATDFVGGSKSAMQGIKSVVASDGTNKITVTVKGDVSGDKIVQMGGKLESMRKQQ